MIILTVNLTRVINIEWEETIWDPSNSFSYEDPLYLCAVSRTVTERDTNDIMGLDPGVTKRGLFKEYTYVHGYKIKTTAKENGIKTTV